ncbi:MAG: biotin/lipoyl-binding protein [Bacillati bacterium ANGP1]|uniref:Biotin/lipoyl-binding protein n=1 Tax=Candidatus Segetimicrobium genomatis TaxID=2569760 RepID=A0A537IXA5_9BACT|nr:MAG: biotin/lipoyl-binding protein [Terrabacteria group bacterium ANGP1]
MRTEAVIFAIVVSGAAAVLAPYRLDSRHVPPADGQTHRVGTALAADLLDVKSSLAGVVQEERLVKAGDQVEDAQPLVYVRTSLTGAIGVAARAPQDGIVREVLVQPGQRIERGDIVARLQPR